MGGGILNLLCSQSLVLCYPGSSAVPLLALQVHSSRRPWLSKPPTNTRTTEAANAIAGQDTSRSARSFTRRFSLRRIYESHTNRSSWRGIAAGGFRRSGARDSHQGECPF